MIQSRTGPLKVSDATLHYEVCGTGPVLLLIPGGPADAGGFAPIRDVLSDRYTVVTYSLPAISTATASPTWRATTASDSAWVTGHSGLLPPASDCPVPISASG